MNSSGQVVRLGAEPAASLRLWVDGRQISSTRGDSLLVAMLLAGRVLRRSEFTREPRAGFCLMGACQDCWVWLECGARIRACTTMAVDGMRVLTAAPKDWPGSV